MRRIALVTGGGRGLGFAIARRLGPSDGKGIVGARSASGGESAAEALRGDEIDAEAVVIDVSSVAGVAAAAEQIGDRHGRLDILVNNAGILPEATEGAGKGPVDLDLFRKTFETNLFGAVCVVQQCLPLLERSEGGRIVNVSSTMGSLADQLNPDSPYYGVVVPAYQGSKAALNAFTIALAKVLRDSPIKVNSVCPGWLQTDLGGPDNRAAAPMTADEGAQIAVEMATLPADGPSGRFVDRNGVVAW
jgi:NAD(P)-dependent dehydrogenase (short-subunit alcohol dehydrogenase family)